MHQADPRARLRQFPAFHKIDLAHLVPRFCRKNFRLKVSLKLRLKDFGSTSTAKLDRSMRKVSKLGFQFALVYSLPTDKTFDYV